MNVNVVNVKLPTHTSHSGKCLHACHMAVNVSKQIFMTQTFKTCVFGEANFQLTNFHNINFQSVCGEANFQFANFQSTNFQLADFQHMTANFQHSHGSQFSQLHMVSTLHNHMACQCACYSQTSNITCGELPNISQAVNVSIQHTSQCLHACHVSNVSTHITQR